MAALSVAMISREKIKPSSPTPLRLKNHTLSFLDQIAPPVYIPLIFFYKNHHDQSQDILKSRLKQSLSQVLTRFYPLAGTILENSSVHCNDTGAELIETHVHTSLAKIVLDPQMDQLKQLLPVDPLAGSQPENGKPNYVLLVQINSFDCGGIAVAVCLSHKVADGTSFLEFMNAWASTSASMMSHCQPPPPPSPDFELATRRFPPVALSGTGVTPNVGISEEKITTKRLVFDKGMLEKLKGAAAAEGDGHPTRVEAVSAFIWRHFIMAGNIDGLERAAKSLVGVHAVSLRPRADPTIPDNAFGNFWRPAFAFVSVTEEGGDLAGRLRAGVRAIDEGYIRKVASGEYLGSLSQTIADLCDRRTVEFCNFSSWCRFPVYEVDFGWGRPVWVCTTTLPFKNLVILMGTPAGDGIEALVNLPENDLDMLQTHYEELLCSVAGERNLEDMAAGEMVKDNI